MPSTHIVEFNNISTHSVKSDNDSIQSVESDDGSVSQIAPFLQILYSDNDVDSSYKEKESETITNVSFAWSVKGYVWSMTLSELNFISEGKKEMVTTNLGIKLIYDNTHNLAFEKSLKPFDINKRLFLSALFEIPRSNRRYLAPLKKLPSNITQCIRAMEQAIDNGTLINMQNIQLNSVNDLALQHILVGIFYIIQNLSSAHQAKLILL